MKSTAIVRKVLRTFDKHSMGYVIMRNYDFLLDNRKQAGKDVDIVVKERDEHKIHRLMLKHGFIKEPICRLSKHTGYAQYVADEQKLLKFHFHLGGITGSFMKYLDDATLLKRKNKIKDFYVISDEDLLISLLMHARFDAPKYHKVLRKLATQKLDISYIQQQLRRLLFKQTAIDVLTAALHPNFKKLSQLRLSIKRSILFRRPQNILKFLWVRFGCGIQQLPRKLKLAPLISLIGMDGAGKTTATTEMVKILEKNRIKSALIYTGRGKKNILPIQAVGRPYKRLEKKARMPKFILKTVYTVAAPFFAADLFIRYWFTIFPKRIRKKIVLTDRYATDMLIMKHVPKTVKKILYFMLPKPTITIYLYNDPKVLKKRKPNHPIEDLYRQEELYNKLIKELSVTKIKSKSKEQVLADVWDAIFDKLIS